MKKRIIIFSSSLMAMTVTSFGQSKPLAGVLPFDNVAQAPPANGGNQQAAPQHLTVIGNAAAGTAKKAAPPPEPATSIQIEDAVSDAILKTKRFSLVDREKMKEIKGERDLQKSEDFIDGSVVEQSKSLGAQYVITGNISKAGVATKQSGFGMVVKPTNGGAANPLGGFMTSEEAEVTFSLVVIDVTTGERVASNSFHATAKGKNAFEDALNKIKPDIARFVYDNFKLTATVAEIEEKSSTGEASKVLIAAGSSFGVQKNDQFKVYEMSVLMVDGKKVPRKKALGIIVVNNVEDENFSNCSVKEGGADIAAKMTAGAKVKCELIN